MAGSPGSGASLEGISLGSSEEAELRREGRGRQEGEFGGKAGPGVGDVWRGALGVGSREPKGVRAWPTRSAGPGRGHRLSPMAGGWGG